MRLAALAALLGALGGVLAVAALAWYGRTAEAEVDDTDAAGDFGPLVSEYRIGSIGSAVH